MRLVLPLSLLLLVAAPAWAESFRCDSSDQDDVWSVEQSVYIKDNSPVGRLVTIRIDAPVTTAPDTDFQANVAMDRAQQPVRGRLMMEIWEVPNSAEPPMVMVQMQMPQYVSIRDTLMAALEDKSNIQGFRIALVAAGRTIATSDQPLVVAKADDLDTAVDTVVSRVTGVSDPGLAAFSTPEDIQLARDIAVALVGGDGSAELQLTALPRSNEEQPELLATMEIEHRAIEASADALQSLLGTLQEQYSSGRCVREE